MEKLLTPVKLAVALEVRPGTVYSWISTLAGTYED